MELVTDWSGHQEWLRDDYAYPLACTVEPMFPGKPELAHWAVVSIAEIKRAMWHVFTHRAEAKAKGELAARLIPQMCSWDVVVENLFRRLRDLVPVQGEVVHSLAMACRRDGGCPMVSCVAGCAGAGGPALPVGPAGARWRVPSGPAARQAAQAAGERPSWVHPDNLIELACADCRVRLRKSGRPAARVLHRFDFAGDLVSTLVVEEDERG